MGQFSKYNKPARLLAGIGIVCLAFFVIYSLLHREPASTDAPTAESATASPVFVPGGLPVSPGPGEVLEPEALVSHADQGLPLIPSEIQHRIREIGIADVDSLRPPAVGEEQRSARRFTFRLFDDVEFTGRVTRLERHSPERAVYFGELENIPGDFILAYNEGAVVATFSTPTLGMYQIRYLGDGRHAAIELNPDALPACEAHGLHAETESSSAPSDLRARSALFQMLTAASEAPPTEGGVYNGFGQQGADGSDLAFTQVDILILHTTAATTAAGGIAGMTALIDTSIARANSAFINSEVALRLRLVRTQQVTYVESGSMETDLTRLRTNIGALSNTGTWRDASGADLVSLFTTASGGLANLYNGSAGSGFSITGSGNAEGTLAHEAGHNFGLLHDRTYTTPATLYPYSYGWRFTPAGAPELRTIMAYTPGLSVPYFSNPDVTYMGTPTGVPIGSVNQSNNAEVLRQTKAAVSAFRSASGNQPPVVSLNSPAYSSSFLAMENVNLAATASDPDGTVAQVRFYRLKSDEVFGFTNSPSIPLGSDALAPFNVTESAAPAGFWTYAAVAFDNSGGFDVDTVSITVAPHYRRVNYPLPSGKTRVSVEGINEAGRVVGYGHTGDSMATNVRAAYWENGTVTSLNSLSGDTGTRAFAVDPQGAVFGESISSTGVRRAVRWNGVNAVDLSGVISGFTAQSAIGVDELGRSYLASDTGHRRFNNPGSTNAGTNQHWQKLASTGVFATGHDYDWGPRAWRAMRWNNGSTQLQPLTGYISSWGRATNRSGAVLGFSSPVGSLSSTTARPTFWPAGSTTPVDLGTFGGTGGYTYGLNDFNHGVGTANNPLNSSLAFVWKGGGALLNLNNLILPQAGLLRDAQAINNRGQIAGTGFDGSAQFLYFLDPLPGLDHKYWLANHFSPAELENPALTDDNANPSGDGIPNLLKRAIGLDPRSIFVPGAADSNPLPQVTFHEDGHLHLIIRRLRTPGDLAYHPEASLTLASGSWQPDLLEVIDVTFLDNDFEEVTLRTQAPVDELDNIFVRLRVTR